MMLAQGTIERFSSGLNAFGQPMMIFGLPVDSETIFMDRTGRYRAAIEKRQRQLIAQTTHINFFLDPDERIRCVTSGCSPAAAIEQLMSGPAYLIFKKAYFVFTDKRIFHIPARSDQNSPRAVSQIMYEDCARVMLNGRSLVIHYKNGAREIFPHIHRKERGRLQALLAGIILKPKETGRLQSRRYLCPGCAEVLEENAQICRACRLKFKSRGQSIIRSMLIPGGGYFYSRYPVLGFVIGIMETALMAALAFQWSNSQAALQTSWLTALLIIGLTVEKTIVVNHSARLIQGFIPEEKEFARRKFRSAI